MYTKLIVLLVLILPGVAFASAQDTWIEALHQCESDGKDTITVLDSNNKYSYGGLQFQLDTFMSYGKKYNILPKEFTVTEGRLFIHNYFVQKAIAKEMLNDGLSSHWRNCTRKIGPYPMAD